MNWDPRMSHIQTGNKDAQSRSISTYLTVKKYLKLNDLITHRLTKNLSSLSFQFMINSTSDVTFHLPPLTIRDEAGVYLCPQKFIETAISFPEPTCLLVLALTKRHVGSGNEILETVEDEMCKGMRKRKKLKSAPSRLR